MIKHCRICNSDTLSKYLTVDDYLLEQCNNCSFIQVSTKPPEAKIKQIYSESYFTHDKYRDTKTLDKENLRRCEMLEVIGLKHGATILDVGCASGDFIKYAKQFYTMYGFDFSPEAIQIAKSRNPELEPRIWVADTDQFLDTKTKFDAICLWDVIEHVWDPLSVCKQLVKLLKPGGFLLFSTPKIDSLSSKILGKYWHFMTPPEHLSFLTNCSIYHLANKTSTKLVKKFNRGKWGNLIFLLKKLKKKFKYIAPYRMIDLLALSPLKSLSIYIPSNDIQYIALQKPTNSSDILSH